MADSPRMLETMGDVETNPFASLKIWRDQLEADLVGQPDRGPDYKLRLLLEQGKDVEIAVQGCLRDTLLELSEAVHWGLLDPAFEEQQRLSLYNQAAVELQNDKQLCLQLALEHGVREDYAREIKRSINRTVSDYERLGDLKFALLVWRANLLRGISLAAPGEQEVLLREGYLEALRLIRRLATRSARFWSVQRGTSEGAAEQLDEGKVLVYRKAVQLVQLRLGSVAEQHGVPQAALDTLFREVSDPEAVALVDEYEDASERPGRDGVYEPPRRGAGAGAGRERRASEESCGTAEGNLL